MHKAETSAFQSKESTNPKDTVFLHSGEGSGCGPRESRESTEGSHDFLVHSGPSHLSSPLSHSIHHDHFIQPKPGYTTEYEEKFVWPPADSYPNSPNRRHYSPTLQESKEEIVSLHHRHHWEQLEHIVRELLSTGHEKTISLGILKKVS